MGASRELGRRGEDAAARHLEGKGYEILERNWRAKVGEIDLVARDGSTVVFVEVKSRSGGRYGLPGEAVDRRRLERIRRAGELFLRERGWSDRPFRIDMITLRFAPSGEPLDVEQIVNVTL